MRLRKVLQKELRENAYRHPNAKHSPYPRHSLNERDFADMEKIREHHKQQEIRTVQKIPIDDLKQCLDCMTYVWVVKHVVLQPKMDSVSRAW